MSIFRCTSTFVLIAVGFAVVAQAQPGKLIPGEAEITPMIARTEQAIQQYKPLLDHEEIQLGADVVANDRKDVASLEVAVENLKSDPLEFNGPAGFALFQWLENASRNAALCASSASMQAESQIKRGNTTGASSLHHLAEGCLDISTLLHTISVNAGYLYIRYADSEKQIAIENAKMLQQCTDMLKKYDTSPIKPLQKTGPL
jgi:hypothetical protein